MNGAEAASEREIGCKKELAKVLVVEENQIFHHYFTRISKGKLNVLIAPNPKVAKAIWFQNSDVRVVIVGQSSGDDRLSQPDDSMITLVREIRNTGFTGPLIAMAGLPCYVERLMRAGCNCIWEDMTGAEERLPELLELLNL